MERFEVRMIVSPLVLVVVLVFGAGIIFPSLLLHRTAMLGIASAAVLAFAWWLVLRRRV